MRLNPARRAFLCLLVIAAPRWAGAQIDPERRQLLQAGFHEPLDGRGPLSGYIYYYLNKPKFLRENLTLRMAVAPVYVDSELGLSKALGPKTDLGFGFAGGGLADSYTEIRQGRLQRAESFKGDGARASVGAYHDFPKIGPLPMAGIVKFEAHHASFERNKKTAPGFATPSNQTELIHRAGLRLGGMEPVLRPTLAGEISIWHEGRHRLAPGTYGYGGNDRRIEAQAQLFWARALFIYNKPESPNRFLASLTGGGSAAHADRFSAYRLGGVLPQASEFPLDLPGYYYQEISARQFFLLNGNYIIPLCADKETWTAEVMAATALVDYADGQAQKGKSHTGTGVGLVYLSPSRAWKVLGNYGYGIDAKPLRGRGKHTIGMLVQYDFLHKGVPLYRKTGPQGGLEHILKRD